MATNLTATRRERARLHFGVHAVLAFAAMVFLGVPFALLAMLVREKSDWLERLDLRVARDLHTFGADHRGFVSAMRVVSNVGSPAAWWVAVVPIALVLVRTGARRRAAFVVVTVAGSWLLNHLVKAAIDRARPHLPDAFDVASGSSFPSGHAQAATVVAGALLVAGWPYLSGRLRAIAVAGAVVVVAAVCFSRVALGVHYVSDVVGGVVLGSAWVLLMSAAFTAWRQEAAGNSAD